MGKFYKETVPSVLARAIKKNLKTTMITKNNFTNAFQLSTFKIIE